MTYKRLLKKCTKKINKHDLVVSKNYTIHNMIPCECFNLNNDTNIKWCDNVCTNVIKKIMIDYGMINERSI